MIKFETIILLLTVAWIAALTFGCQSYSQYIKVEDAMYTCKNICPAVQSYNIRSGECKCTKYKKYIRRK